jgi:hypothetical protein
LWSVCVPIVYFEEQWTVHILNVCL